MADVISLAPFEIFMPLVAFLFIFVLVFALLKKTALLGSDGVNVFISFLVSIIFIVNVQLVDFVKLSTSWVVVFVVCLFFILFVSSIVKAPEEVLTKNKNVAWIIIGLVVILLIFSSSYVFNWAINWDLLRDWFDEEWFGTVVLLVIAGIVSWNLTKAVKK